MMMMTMNEWMMFTFAFLLLNVFPFLEIRDETHVLYDKRFHLCWTLFSVSPSGKMIFDIRFNPHQLHNINVCTLQKHCHHHLGSLEENKFIINFCCSWCSSTWLSSFTAVISSSLKKSIYVFLNVTIWMLTRLAGTLMKDVMTFKAERSIKVSEKVCLHTT